MQRAQDRQREAPPRDAVPLIAIVDDDASVRTSTCRLVRTFGFAAAGYDSAEAFVESGQAVRTTCLILDVRMPGMGGLALQRHLADHDLPIPIVFFTAHPSAVEEQAARQAGAIDFLHKPVGAEVLRRVLRSVVDAQTATP